MKIYNQKKKMQKENSLIDIEDFGKSKHKTDIQIEFMCNILSV